MPAEIIDLNRKRVERMLRRQVFDERSFDRELTRRLALFLAGEDLPDDLVPDAPRLG